MTAAAQQQYFAGSAGLLLRYDAKLVTRRLSSRHLHRIANKANAIIGKHCTHECMCVSL
jgi:hypothetical protein